MDKTVEELLSQFMSQSEKLTLSPMSNNQQQQQQLDCHKSLATLHAQLGAVYATLAQISSAKRFIDHYNKLAQKAYANSASAQYHANFLENLSHDRQHTLPPKL